MATSKRMKLSAALLTLMIAGWSGIAAAKPCKDFDIKVQNNFAHDGIGQPIKVVDFDYWDDDKGKWREENWVGNLVIDFDQESHHCQSQSRVCRRPVRRHYSGSV